MGFEDKNFFGLGTTRVSINLDIKLVVGDIAGNPIISRSWVLFYIFIKLFLFTSNLYNKFHSESNRQCGSFVS